MTSRRLPLILCALLVFCALPMPQSVSAEDSEFTWPPSHVVISEVLVSASSADYNGTDWNGDGYIGSSSDQFIELWNPTDQIVNISNWVLDDVIGGGSPACSIGWDTELAPGARLAFFRDYTEIELDYWNGDTVNLQDDQGNLIHTMSYPSEDSWWDVPYTILENGTYWKDFDGPSPGADEPANWTGPSTGGNCYTVTDNSHADEYILTGRIVTMTGEGAVFDGGVLIQSGKITSVWSGANIPTSHAGIQVVETDGTIYPGLIDLHNHMHYNHIPLWDFTVHLSESQRSEEGGYTNRYQWGNNYDYGPSITWMKTHVQSSSRWDMTSAQMKYAEVQAVAGGVTAVQGSPSSGTDAWDSMLSRNVELYNFGQDGMSTCAVCGSHEDDYTGSHLISQNESGSLNAWFVHLSEGVDASSKAEFESLYEKGLIMDETVVIHGTALDESQFTKMAEKGAGLVWSPISNLLLYGDTTDVVAADNSGVTISLAPDWGPSGSKSNLHELKTADLWNTDVLNGHFSDYELVQMVTSNPAEISNWQDFVGQIEVDMYADLVVIDTFHANPYRNLIEAIDRDVLLTIVQGKAVFGDVDLMTDLQGNDWEYINGSGFSKAIDVTSVSVEDGSQTWESIESGLAMAMRNEVGDIREHWSEVSDLNTDQEVQDYLDSKFDGDYNDGVSHLRNLTLDPIFTMNDDRYFDVINRSAHANFHVDMSKLYDYYNVAYDAASSRPFIDSDFTPPAQDVNGCTDSTATNYDSSATVDNGSCTYVDNGGDDIDDIGDVIDDFIFNSTDPIVVVMEVQFEGSKSGTITFELYPDKAPYHVDNILRHIDAGNYDGAIFHRVIDNFMIQGGDFENNIGTGGFAAGWYGYCNGQESQENSCVQTSWTVPDEADNGLSHEPGALSMAKTAMPHTGGSQFFIVDEEGGQYHLDGIHTVFGMVIDGMDVVDDISETDTTYTDKPVEDVVIVSFSRADENSSELTTPTSPSSDSSSSWIQIGIIVASIVILFSIAMMSSMMRGPEMGGSHGGSDQYFKSGVERQEAMTDVDLDTDLDLDKPDVGKP